jgi:small-conductance mechanosensitive channel
MDFLDNIAPKPNDPTAQIASKIAAYYHTVSDWILQNWFEMLLAIIIGGLFFVFLGYLKRWAARSRLILKDENPFSLSAIAMRTLGRTSRFFRAMVSIELVNELANTPPSIARIIGVLFTISVVVQIAIWLRAIILGLIERRAGQGGHEHDTLANAMVLIRLMVSIGLFAIAAIVILDNLGVNVTGLVAGLGVGGIAIGLAAQGIFSDLFAAIAIILDKPFRVGDSISYNTSTATVEKIGMKSTRLRSIGGELLVISNAKLLDMEITNISDTGYRRTKYPIGVIYQTPPEKAREIPAILKQIVEAEGGEFVRAGFVGFGDSSIDFELYFDVFSDSFQEVFAARHRIGISIIETFHAQGYAFAYPTQTTFTSAPDGAMMMPYYIPETSPSAKPRKT